MADAISRIFESNFKGDDSKNKYHQQEPSLEQALAHNSAWVQAANSMQGAAINK